jgi:cytochrome P450
MTLLLAGHETTASGLAWTLDLLLHHPRVMNRLIEEFATDSDTYLDAVIKESLRVRPVVIEVGRRLRQPLTLKDRDLPAGVLAVAQIYLVHRRADIYPDPDAFRPERFLEKAPETYSWIPFGGGTRRCLGAAFATVELRVVLRAILSRAQLRAASSRLDGSRRRIVTLVPKRGASVILDRLLETSKAVTEQQLWAAAL